MVAVLATDIVFAVDSVPAVYGITGDPYLVFATNAFALLGLRALYFVLEDALGSLVHLGHGLARHPRLHRRQARAALGARHVAGRARDPDLLSLGVIVIVLVVVTLTSLRATRNALPAKEDIPADRR